SRSQDSVWPVPRRRRISIEFFPSSPPRVGSAQMVRRLNAPRVFVAELAPAHDRAVGLDQALLDPAPIIAVELLGGLSRGDVLIVESLERNRLPAMDEFVRERAPLGLRGNALAERDQIEVRVLGDGNVPFELKEARIG